MMYEFEYEALGREFSDSHRPVSDREFWKRSLYHFFLVPTIILCLCLISGLTVRFEGIVLGLGASLLILLSDFLMLWSFSKVCRRSRELGDLLLQSRKMAAVGEMSSGIAHEINTPLNIISQESEWLRHLVVSRGDNQPPDKDFLDSLDQIDKQIRRCGEITHGMINFARSMHMVEQSTDINSLMEDMVLWVEREVKKDGISFERKYAENMPKIMTDAPMLRHVILNLLNNASQAVGPSGRVIVSTSADVPDYIILRVEDNGPGIPKKYMESIFNPFFTTKAPGKGTGLGLPISLAIVTKLGGMIKVKSKLGKGTCFDVRLPCKRTGE